MKRSGDRFDPASIAALLRQTEENLSLLGRPSGDGMPRASSRGASPQPVPFNGGYPPPIPPDAFAGLAAPKQASTEFEVQVQQLRAHVERLEATLQDELRSFLGVCEKRLNAKEESLRAVCESVQATSNEALEVFGRRVDARLRDLDRSTHDHKDKMVEEVWDSLRHLQADHRSMEARLQRCSNADDVADRLRESSSILEQKVTEKCHNVERRAVEHRAALDSSQESWREAMQQRFAALEQHVWEQQGDRNDLVDAVLRKLPEAAPLKDLREALHAQEYSAEVAQRRLTAVEAKVSKVPSLEASAEFTQAQVSQRLEEAAHTQQGLSDRIQRLATQMPAIEAVQERMAALASSSETRLDQLHEELREQRRTDMEQLQQQVSWNVGESETKIQRSMERMQQAIEKRLQDALAHNTEGLEQSCREAVQRARDAQAHADGATDALRKQLERVVTDSKADVQRQADTNLRDAENLVVKLSTKSEQVLANMHPLERRLDDLEIKVRNELGESNRNSEVVRSAHDRLEPRMSELQATTENLRDNMEGLRSRLVALQGNTDTIRSTVNSLDDLKSNVARFNSNVDVFRKDMNDHRERLAGCERTLEMPLRDRLESDSGCQRWLQMSVQAETRKVGAEIQALVEAVQTEMDGLSSMKIDVDSLKMRIQQTNTITERQSESTSEIRERLVEIETDVRQLRADKTGARQELLEQCRRMVNALGPDAPDIEAIDPGKSAAGTGSPAKMDKSNLEMRLQEQEQQLQEVRHEVFERRTQARENRIDGLQSQIEAVRRDLDKNQMSTASDGLHSQLEVVRREFDKHRKSTASMDEVSDIRQQLLDIKREMTSTAETHRKIETLERTTTDMKRQVHTAPSTTATVNLASADAGFEHIEKSMTKIFETTADLTQRLAATQLTASEAKRCAEEAQAKAVSLEKSFNTLAAQQRSPGESNGTSGSPPRAGSSEPPFEMQSPAAESRAVVMSLAWEGSTPSDGSRDEPPINSALAAALQGTLSSTLPGDIASEASVAVRMHGHQDQAGRPQQGAFVWVSASDLSRVEAELRRQLQDQHSVLRQRLQGVLPGLRAEQSSVAVQPWPGRVGGASYTQVTELEQSQQLFAENLDQVERRVLNIEKNMMEISLQLSGVSPLDSKTSITPMSLSTSDLGLSHTHDSGMSAPGRNRAERGVAGTSSAASAMTRGHRTMPSQRPGQAQGLSPRSEESSNFFEQSSVSDIVEVDVGPGAADQGPPWSRQHIPIVTQPAPAGSPTGASGEAGHQRSEGRRFEEEKMNKSKSVLEDLVEAEEKDWREIERLRQEEQLKEKEIELEAARKERQRIEEEKELELLEEERIQALKIQEEVEKQQRLLEEEMERKRLDSIKEEEERERNRRRLVEEEREKRMLEEEKEKERKKLEEQARLEEQQRQELEKQHEKERQRLEEEKRQRLEEEERQKKRLEEEKRHKLEQEEKERKQRQFEEEEREKKRLEAIKEQEKKRQQMQEEQKKLEEQERLEAERKERLRLEEEEAQREIERFQEEEKEKERILLMEEELKLKRLKEEEERQQEIIQAEILRETQLLEEEEKRRRATPQQKSKQPPAAFKGQGSGSRSKRILEVPRHIKLSPTAKASKRSKDEDVRKIFEEIRAGSESEGLTRDCLFDYLANYLGFGQAEVANFFQKNSVAQGSGGNRFVTFEKFKESYASLNTYFIAERDKEQIFRKPGSIGGQQVQLDSLNDCDVFICDIMDSAMVDQCTNCRILLGPGENSVFIRNCTDCTFWIACGQLRTRDCENCKIFLYAKSDPCIEKSFNMKFAPWAASFPGCVDQFQKQAWNTNRNMWNAIFDFTGSDKHANWTIIPLADCEMLTVELDEPAELELQSGNPVPLLSHELLCAAPLASMDGASGGFNIPQTRPPKPSAPSPTTRPKQVLFVDEDPLAEGGVAEHVSDDDAFEDDALDEEDLLEEEEEEEESDILGKLARHHQQQKQKVQSPSTGQGASSSPSSAQSIQPSPVPPPAPSPKPPSPLAQHSAPQHAEEPPPLKSGELKMEFGGMDVSDEEESDEPVEESFDKDSDEEVEAFTQKKPVMDDKARKSLVGESDSEEDSPSPKSKAQVEFGQTRELGQPAPQATAKGQPSSFSSKEALGFESDDEDVPPRASPAAKRPASALPKSLSSPTKLALVTSGSPAKTGLKAPGGLGLLGLSRGDIGKLPEDDSFEDDDDIEAAIHDLMP